MKVLKVNGNVRIKPTEKKIKKAEQVTESLLEKMGPYEVPLEKKVTFVSPAEAFERIKDKIQISIENMKKGRW